MNPQTMAWGGLTSLQPAMLVGSATLLGLVFSRDRKLVAFDSLMVLILILWLHFLLTSLNAIYPDEAWRQFSKVSKIFLMTFVTIMVIQTPERLRILLLVCAYSLGFFALNGAIWGVMTGGSQTFWGPENSFLAGNNEIALALNMNIPILYYFGLYDKNKWIRRSCFVLFLCSIPTIILTYSRGGLIGLVAVFFFIAMTTERKVRIIVLVFVLLLLAPVFVPQKWYDRMDTIQTYEEDVSAIARLNTWKYCWNLAIDNPLLGGGFEAFSEELFAIYAPWYEGAHDAHSVYFEILAEHGFTGLAIFFAILVNFMFSLLQISKIAATIPSLEWMKYYSRAILCSGLAFLASGTFLGLAYFDFFWLIIATAVIMKLLWKKYLQELNLLMHLQYENNAQVSLETFLQTPQLIKSSSA